MIYRPAHNMFIYNFLKLYTLWKIRRNFREVSVSGAFIEKDLPILLIVNHFSWWDGFWAMYLNLKLFHRRFYFMMLEEELRKNIFLNKSGGYSIKRRSRSVIETIDLTAELLGDKRNIVLLFPQGEIRSLYTRRIIFENGVDHILNRVKKDVQILFLVNLVDYFSGQKPGLYMYFKEYQEKTRNTKNMEEEYNNFYDECMAENLCKTETE